MDTVTALFIQKTILTALETLNKARISARYFSRNRKMPFESIMRFLFDMSKSSLQTRLNDFFRQNGGGIPMSQQAFSAARSHFTHYPFEATFRALVAEEYSGKYELPTFRGYHVFADDGSYLQLPNTAKLREAYGTRGRGHQCACAGISILYDVMHGWPLDPIMSKADMNERELCIQHLTFLQEQLPHLYRKVILLLDRGYPSKDLLVEIQNAEIKYLIRCTNDFCTEVRDAPMGDSLTTLKNGLVVRVYKFMLSSGEIETLLTNLFDEPAEFFPELYAMRWHIEGMYDCLKNTLRLENFSGRNQNTVLQDFWVTMVFMVMTAIFQKEADTLVQEERKDKDNKHSYKANTSDLVVTLRDQYILAAFYEDAALASAKTQEIVQTLARSVIPIRPGRSAPRPNDMRKHFINLSRKSHL
jgi:hypothetical protein